MTLHCAHDIEFFLRERSSLERNSEKKKEADQAARSRSGQDAAVAEITHRVRGVCRTLAGHLPT